MKLLKKSIEVEAVLFTEELVPRGVLFEGFNPATTEFKEAYIETPVGRLPIKYGDYVIYENDKMYPCTSLFQCSMFSYCYSLSFFGKMLF